MISASADKPETTRSRTLPKAFDGRMDVDLESRKSLGLGLLEEVWGMKQ